MFQDRMNVWNRLSELWTRTDIPVLELKDRKYAILSDIHLGNNSPSDDFVKNEPALLYALDYYYENGFSLILLGDIEELWQFDLHAIKEHYDNTVYTRLRKFSPGRVTRIFGNHDYEWGGFVDPIHGVGTASIAPEAVKLADEQGIPRILLVHGHQGTIESDKFSWFSRFWVRLFSFIEPLAISAKIYTSPSSTKSQIAQDYERTLYQWAKENKVLLICGHSHRAIFASRSYAEKINEEILQLEAENSRSKTSATQRRKNFQKIRELNAELQDEKAKGRMIEATDPGKTPLPCYFNTGCGLYSDGLTALEISEGNIRLVKWCSDALPSSAYQKYDEDNLSSILQKIAT